MQVMAVAFGGALGAIDHELVECGHVIRTVPGSLAGRLLGPRCRTSALHRQAITAPGEWWRPTARAEDETVEAIEPVDPDWPALGVQWHPELGDHPVLGDGTGPALFGWLVNHAVNPSTRRETAHGNHISPTFHG
jgi:putative glutamine amidotransferase